MISAYWAVTQMQDQDLSKIIWLYKAKQLDMAKLCDFESRDVKALLSHRLWLKLWKGVLYLKTSPNWEDWNDMRLDLPWAYWDLARQRHHDGLGHLSTECMLDLLCNSFYWPIMQSDMDQHVWNCDRCNWFKAHLQHEKLYPILATYLLELVHIDFLMIKNPKTRKDVNVLVITYHFT